MGFFKPSDIEQTLFKVDDDRRWYEEDTLVTELGSVRNTVGVVTGLVVSLMTAGIHGSAFSPTGRVFDLLIAVAITGVAVLATMALLVLTTSSGHRKSVLRRMLTPLRTILIYPFTLAAPIVTAIVGYTYLPRMAGSVDHSEHKLLTALGILALFLVLLAVALVTLRIALFGAYFCVTAVFRAAEGHPLLAPVAATAVVWVYPQLLRIMQHADLPTDPLGIAVFYGGAVTVTLLSAFEIVRAAQVPGLDLRGAPPPTPLPRGSGSLRIPGLPVLVSLTGAFAATTAFAALAVAGSPEPTGAPVANRFFLPDGGGEVKLARLSPDGTRLVAGSDRNRTFVFDTRTAKIVDTFRLDVGHPTALAFSPDGRLLAEAGNRIRSPSIGSPVYLWDIAAHRLVTTLAIAPDPTGRFTETLAFSNDGTRLAVGLSDGGAIQVWNTATGASAAKFAVPGQKKGAAANTLAVYDVAYLPDGTTMGIRTANGLFFVNATSGAITPIPGTTLDRIAGTINGFAVSADGSTLAYATHVGVTGGSEIVVGKLRPGSGSLAIPVPGAAELAVVTSLALNDDGSMVAAGDWDGHVHLWATADGHPVGTLDTKASWDFWDAPTDIVSVHAVRGSSALLDWDERDNLVLWDLSGLPGSGAWNKTTK
ncbi:MAG: repeat-containing protein [Frankiales bacterium]|nr:repeat-containing protein [Frankiales bacterium]